MEIVLSEIGYSVEVCYITDHASQIAGIASRTQTFQRMAVFVLRASYHEHAFWYAEEVGYQ